MDNRCRRLDTLSSLAWTG